MSMDDARMNRRKWSARKNKLGTKILDRENAERLDDHHLLCCWDTCERFAVSLHQAVEDWSTPGHPLIRRYFFCTEGHKMYWVNSVRDLYNLPSGYKKTLL